MFIDKRRLMYFNRSISTLLFAAVFFSFAAGEDESFLYVDAKIRVFHTKDGRKYNDYRRQETLTVDQLKGYRSKPDRLSRYGGLAESKHRATGFYRVEKIDGRWWAIDPDGHRFIQKAVNCVNISDCKESKEAFAKKFRSKQDWVGESLNFLIANGFNGAGAWSDVDLIQQANAKSAAADESGAQFSYCINLNFMSTYGRERGGTFFKPGHTGYANDAIFVFDDRFPEFCDEHARRIIKHQSDPNLFGYFSDNELPFKLNALENYLQLTEDDPGRIAAEKWLADRGVKPAEITAELQEDFAAFVGKTYFSIVNKVIKKHDPNHLFLGSRFYSKERQNEKFMRATGKYIDVISINYYHRWTPRTPELEAWEVWTGKPFIVSEFYVKGDDSGLPNLSGAGWLVRTQKDRGLFYQNYCLGLLKSSNCIGWHYFKYQDEDPDWKSTNLPNPNTNKGILDLHYNAWRPMVDEMQDLNCQAYGLIEYFKQRSN